MDGASGHVKKSSRLIFHVQYLELWTESKRRL